VNLPADLSGEAPRAALERIGFVFQRRKGSHMVLKRSHPPARVVVPDHRRLRPGTLRQIVHEAGLSIEDLKRLL
jgi:predicted RNA binding protein YcfA (HicA-like mRNA interferase family)